MNVGNSYEVFFLAISLLFCVCKLPVFYQGEAKSMAKWFSTEEFPSICWGVKTYIDQCECLDYCLLVLTLRSSLSLGKLQSTMALSDPRLGSRLLSLFSIWQAPTNWELISFKDDGSDYPQVHWIYLCYQFQNVNHGQGLRCFFYKAKASSHRYRDRILLIPGECIPTNDSPDPRRCSWALLIWLPSQRQEDCQLGEPPALSPQNH